MFTYEENEKKKTKKPCFNLRELGCEAWDKILKAGIILRFKKCCLLKTWVEMRIMSSGKLSEDSKKQHL